METLSVVIPAFNVEKYIGETIECIVNQTYKDWILYVVDDHSTDNTANIILSYAEKDPRVHYILRSRDPKGAQTCRNTGIGMANGKYTIIFDSDDIIAPYCFEQRIKFMENHEEVDYATFRGQAFYTKEKGRKVYTHKWGEPNNDDLLMGFLSTDYPFGI